MTARGKRYMAIVASTLLSLSVPTCFANGLSVQLSRYVSGDTQASHYQHSLLDQTLSITFPEDVSTIGQAVDYLLRFSGFKLAPTEQRSTALKTILTQSLPESLRHLDNVSLSQALLSLAGNEFVILSDGVNRQINFELSSNVQVGRYSTMAGQATPEQIAPLLQKRTITFGSNVHTVGEAVNQALAGTGFALTQHPSFHLKSTLKKPLPATARHFENTSINDVLAQLVGNDAYHMSVNPVERSVNFCLLGKSCHVERQTTQHHIITKVVPLPAIDQFLERKDFVIRTALPLKFKAHGKDLVKAIVTRNKKSPLYFGFNDKDKIVGVANAQREANALAQKNRSVFYAVSGQTLRQTINRWASYSNTKVFFNTKKALQLQANSVFFGTFKSSSGALSQLLQAADLSGVSLRAQFRVNNTLIIHDHHSTSLFLTPEKTYAP